MKCVSEMQFIQYFCYLTVKYVPICCKILLGDVRRIVVAFAENRIPSHYPKCILVSRGKNSSLFRSLAKPFGILEKTNILFFLSVLVGTVLTFL